MSEKNRSRTFDLLLYDEDESHKEALKKLDTGYKYIAIKHDKDVWSDDDKLPDGVKVGDLKKAHWHVIIRFPQGRWDTAIAKELGIAINYIQKCVSYEGSLLYLIHKGLPDKYQYSPDECIGNLTKDLEKALECDSDLNDRVMSVLSILDERDFWTVRSFLEVACQRGRIGEALRMAGLIAQLISVHNEENGYHRPDAGAYVDACDQHGFANFVQGYECGRKDKITPPSPL